MKIFSNAAEAKDILTRGKFDDADRAAAVREIVRQVREQGDRALFAYCQQFDGSALNAGNVAVSDEEIARAYERIDPAVLASLRNAIRNIYTYHSRYLRRISLRVKRGRMTGYVMRPVTRAGIYVPGGTAPLVSSVAMGVLPARAAGVREIYACTPAKNGAVDPAVVVAAHECGVTKLFKAGGAQAIAALAYGTESIPRVDVIAGPGNIYVTLAKKEVYGQVGIDMLAGPSEILIIADGAQDPAFIAADVLSQAEHDKLARSIVLTDDAAFAAKLSEEVDRRLERLPRRDIAAQALHSAGGIILVRDMNEACALANEIAPEHLELATQDCDRLLNRIEHAGAVFLGSYTPEPVGDYFAGPDHILPTGGTARFFEALNVETFLRKMSVIRYTRKAVLRDGQDIIRLAECEGLHAHAEAVRVRLEDKK